MTMFPLRLAAAYGIAAGLLASHAAFAGQVQMIESQPLANAILHGDHAEYVVRFDGPVNHFASHMEIMQAGRVVHTMKPLQDSAVDVLFSAGPVPAAGHYSLHWTAVSADGVTSVGDIPFTTQ